MLAFDHVTNTDLKDLIGAILFVIIIILLTRCL